MKIMNKQLVRRAIEVFNNFHDELLEAGAFEDVILCSTAIEALEKQLVLKPLREDTKECIEYKCPSCWSPVLTIYTDGTVVGGKEKMCECGQKLDWSE